MSSATALVGVPFHPDQHLSDNPTMSPKAAQEAKSAEFIDDEDDVPYEVGEVNGHIGAGHALTYMVGFKQWPNSSSPMTASLALSQCPDLIEAYWAGRPAVERTIALAVPPTAIARPVPVTAVPQVTPTLVVPTIIAGGSRKRAAVNEGVGAGEQPAPKRRSQQPTQASLPLHEMSPGLANSGASVSAEADASSAPAGASVAPAHRPPTPPPSQSSSSSSAEQSYSPPHDHLAVFASPQLPAARLPAPMLNVAPAPAKVDAAPAPQAPSPPPSPIHHSQNPTTVPSSPPPRAPSLGPVDRQSVSSLQAIRGLPSFKKNKLSVVQKSVKTPRKAPAVAKKPLRSTGAYKSPLVVVEPELEELPPVKPAAEVGELSGLMEHPPVLEAPVLEAVPNEPEAEQRQQQHSEVPTPTPATEPARWVVRVKKSSRKGPPGIPARRGPPGIREDEDDDEDNQAPIPSPAVEVSVKSLLPVPAPESPVVSLVELPVVETVPESAPINNAPAVEVQRGGPVVASAPVASSSTLPYPPHTAPPPASPLPSTTIPTPSDISTPLATSTSRRATSSTPAPAPVNLSSRAERQRLILESAAHTARFLATVVAAPSPARSESSETDSAREADEVGEMLVPSPVKPREDELEQWRREDREAEERKKRNRIRREREPDGLDAVLRLRGSLEAVVEGHHYTAMEQLNRKALDWEPLVKQVIRVELLPECKLALLVWALDDSYSWVNTEVVNARCPQRMIEFYIRHEIFE